MRRGREEFLADFIKRYAKIIFRHGGILLSQNFSKKSFTHRGQTAKRHALVNNSKGVSEHDSSNYEPDPPAKC